MRHCWRVTPGSPHAPGGDTPTPAARAGGVQTSGLRALAAGEASSGPVVVPGRQARRVEQARRAVPVVVEDREDLGDGDAVLGAMDDLEGVAGGERAGGQDAQVD